MTCSVSVTMPAYNAERYIRESVDSVLAQTFGDFELLIVDDGSTDGTRRIADDYARRDPRVRVLGGAHAGVAAARNQAVAAAQGRYVAVQDADDVAMPERFRLQFERMERDPACVAVGSNFERIDPEGVRIETVELPLTHEELDHRHMTTAVAGIANSTAMIRTEAIRRLGGYRAEFQPAEDFDLWLRLAEIGRIANVPESLERYRLHESSLSHQGARTQADNAVRAVAEACARRGVAVAADVVAQRKDAVWVNDRPRCEWVKMALRAGNYTGARRLAVKAVKERPLSRYSWRLLAETLRAGAR